MKAFRIMFNVFADLVFDDRNKDNNKVNPTPNWYLTTRLLELTPTEIVYLVIHLISVRNVY